MSKIIKGISILYLLILVLFPVSIVNSQTLLQDKVEIIKAEVIEVVDHGMRDIVGTDLKSIYQTVTVRFIEGDNKDKEVKIENDYIKLSKGDRIYVFHSTDSLSGKEMYSVRDIDRSSVIFALVAIFVVVIIIFSGKQGLRSILSLIGSFFVILYFLIPSLLNGYPPIITSIVIAILILFFAIYFTHGFNRHSTVAFIGTVISIIFTGLLAYFAVYYARLTGFSSDEAVYLNFNTKGTLDFAGLMLGGIIIGVLGVLDDIAITQTSVVNEIYSSAPNLSKREVYFKALRVGREHVGALVNTLALAYTGASLPLLLLFSMSETSKMSILNKEIFVVEIIRTIVGSIGLILTVPITTFLAVYMIKNNHNSNLTSHNHSH